MPKFEVQVTRSYTTAVEVEAENGDAAIERVTKRDFPLPSLGEWQGQKDWMFRAYDEQGEEVAELDS